MTRTVQQKYVRSALNKGQIELLDLVYKYRFVSRQLVAESLGVKPENGLYEKLEVLVRREYLGKRFDKRLKLQAVPAAYYLTPKALRDLQALPHHEGITDVVIKNSYKDKTVGQDFIAHTLNVYKYTNLFMRRYPTLKVFTRRDMARYSYFPPQPPDAFLSLPTDDPKQPRRFFFDLISDTMPRSALDRRIASYCEFFDEGGWDVTGSDVPVLLLLSEWGPAEKRIQRNVRAQFSRSGMEELPAYTSTTSALEHMTGAAVIWTSVEDTDELAELSSIS
ncbi:MAG TPA: hypothetical protein VLF69_03020 [Candidatus Saccharimonadales bacterium]|nr:hypothetical protein [Candidatus Saccharimonadales bacterium]